MSECSRVQGSRALEYIRRKRILECVRKSSFRVRQSLESIRSVSSKSEGASPASTYQEVEVDEFQYSSGSSRKSSIRWEVEGESRLSRREKLALDFR